MYQRANWPKLPVLTGVFKSLKHAHSLTMVFFSTGCFLQTWRHDHLVMKKNAAPWEVHR
jgi:hypothetical protein